MGNVRLYGSTSGYTELAPPAVAPDGVLSLPSGVGTLLTAEGGKVLQVVREADGTNRSTTSTSYVDVSGMTVTITPKSATSTIIILAFARVYVDRSGGGEGRCIIRIANSSNTGLSGAEDVVVGGNSALNIMETPLAISAVENAGSVSARTYKLRFSIISAGSTISFGNDTVTGQMYAIEVSA